MTLKTTPFVPDAHLDTPEGVEAFLADAFQTGTAPEIAQALGIVARARGMSALAEDTGLTRQTLYKALSADGNPELGTIMKVAGALGFRILPVPISTAA